jgi:hypothetical protein
MGTALHPPSEKDSVRDSERIEKGEQFAKQRKCPEVKKREGKFSVERRRTESSI